jgi:hypothetical protein
MTRRFIWALVVAHKVDVPNSFIYLLETPIFEWYVVWRKSKNIYQKAFVWKILDFVVQIYGYSRLNN